MKNQYYLKDKKLQLYKEVVVVDEIGNREIFYVAATPAAAWCFARQLSQAQIYEATAAGHSETKLFVIGAKTEIDLNDIILYCGKWYSLTRIDTYNDYKGDIYVYGAIMDEPGEDYIKPYGWEPPEE